MCEDIAMAALPSSFPLPQRRVMWTMLQLHHGDPDVHYELQPHVGRGLVELGLHFESSPEANEQWAGIIADHTVALMAALGDGWELEEWTASWRRLHRTFAFDRLTADLAREVAEQFTALLTTLQPLLDTAHSQGAAPAPALAEPSPAPSQRAKGRYSRRSARR